MEKGYRPMIDSVGTLGNKDISIEPPIPQPLPPPTKSHNTKAIYMRKQQTRTAAPITLSKQPNARCLEQLHLDVHQLPARLLAIQGLVYPYHSVGPGSSPWRRPAPSFPALLRTTSAASATGPISLHDLDHNDSSAPHLGIYNRTKPTRI